MTFAELKATLWAAPRSETIDETGERAATRTSGLRIAAAALLAATGVIHLSMAPSHWNEWKTMGIGFLVAGWLQLAAAWVALRVSGKAFQRWMGFIALTSFELIVVWAISRTNGLPFGPAKNVAEDASFIDVLAVVFEAVTIVACIALAVRPHLRIGRNFDRLAIGALVPLSVVVLASAAMASPSAVDHAHSSNEAAGTGATSSDGHLHADGTTALASDGHVDAAGASSDSAHSASEHSSHEIAFLFPDGNDRGWAELANGEQHPHSPDVAIATLDPATRAEYTRQLALTLDVVKKYPTVKSAVDAGFRRAGPFTPGLGAHYTAPFTTAAGSVAGTAPLTDQQILNPTTIVYDGVEPDSRIAGFMYAAIGPLDGDEPAGFAGPNDHWHTHKGICIKGAADGSGIDALGADGSITESECTAQGGRFLNLTQWLLHVWTSPDYTSPLGVFSHLNPAVTCGDGSYHTIDYTASERALKNQCVTP